MTLFTSGAPILSPHPMIYQSKPTVDGVYLIKVLSKDLFIESVSGDEPKLQLAALSMNDSQKWSLNQVPGKIGVWKMACVDGSAGLAYTIHKNLYWGYGDPNQHTANSCEWNFIEHDQRFSKIKLNDDSDCFDACQAGSNTIHFYSDQKHDIGAPHQCYVFGLLPSAKSSKRALDVLFLQDFTYSQSSYIDRSKREINEVCSSIVKLSEGELALEDLRFGLIAFRDHPPQDYVFVSKRFNFTNDTSTMASYLGSLTVGGGGDGPEAQCDALFDALHSPWNQKATKVAVLITDAPPHGLGEENDGFPNGCPCGHDPLQIADEMLKSGITLYVVACEPLLSSYKHARHFYEGLTQKTGGQVYNLGNPSGLTDVIVGCLLQEADSDILVSQYQGTIHQDVSAGELNPDEIALRLHEYMLNANVSHYSLNVDDMVEANEAGKSNVQEWYKAADLTTAKGKIKQVPPNRIKPEYSSGKFPSSSMRRSPITLTQVQGIVRKSLSRRH